ALAVEGVGYPIGQAWQEQRLTARAFDAGTELAAVVELELLFVAKVAVADDVRGAVSEDLQVLFELVHGVSLTIDDPEGDELAAELGEHSAERLAVAGHGGVGAGGGVDD